MAARASLFFFSSSGESVQQEAAWTIRRKQDTERRGGEAEELTHSSVGAFVAQWGTESSGALLNISSIWCHYRPSDHRRHHQRRPRDSALQAGELAGDGQADQELITLNKSKSYDGAAQRQTKRAVFVLRRCICFKEVKGWKQTIDGADSLWAGSNRCWTSDQTLFTAAHTLAADPTERWQQAPNLSHFYLLLEMDDISTQALVLPSVSHAYKTRVSVPVMFICTGLISKSFFLLCN